MFQTGGLPDLVTWQSNEEAVTSHWHGFWTQNPRTCSEVKNSHFSIFRIFSYHGKVAKPKTTHVYPCGPRQHKAFLGIFPLSRRVLKPTTTCDAVFQVCFGSGSIMVRSWSWFYQASEVLQLVDLLAGSDALTVSCVCPCQAPATGQVCSSSVCQVQYLVLLLKWREWSHVAFESIGVICHPWTVRAYWLPFFGLWLNHLLIGIIMISFFIVHSVVVLFQVEPCHTTLTHCGWLQSKQSAGSTRSISKTKSHYINKGSSSCSSTSSCTHASSSSSISSCTTLSISSTTTRSPTSSNTGTAMTYRIDL